MVRLIRRYLRALGYLLTGRFAAARRAIDDGPQAVSALYEQIIADKNKSIQIYKDAIARLIVQHDTKMSKIRSLTNGINQLEQSRETAANAARSVVAQMKSNGASMEQIKSNETYRQHMLMFSECTAKLDEKNPQVTEFEEEVTELDQTIQGHKVQLKQMLKEVERLKAEQADAVAEVMTTRDAQELQDMLGGFAGDRTARDLEEMRRLRSDMKAKTRVANDLAGINSMAREAEAHQHMAAEEFDRLTGLTSPPQELH